MFTSDTTIDKRSFNGRNAVAFLASCAFCAFFSSVYAKFSHGVTSDYMTFLCLIPLIGGVLPYSILYFFNLKAPGGIDGVLYNWGVLTLIFGFAINGAVEISGYEIDSISFFGAEIAYMSVYYFFAAALMSVGAVTYAIKCVKSREKSRGK